MKVGCFALIDPFSTLDHQLQRIEDMEFKYADVTDSHPGSSLGRDYGFAATASLDENPMDLKRLFDKHGLTITTVCAHASLLDPVSPSRFGTHEITKAIMLAQGMGVEHVVTTEGHPHTNWANNLSFAEQVLVVAEKLYEPVRLAGDMGVRVLLEPHGPLTDTIEGMEALFERLGNPESLGINIDTGNSWLGGSDPVVMAKTFKDRIYHIHWKDLPAEWEEKRGTMWGCGMGPIALGDGVVDVAGVFEVLKDAPHVEYSTLEVGGDDNLIRSYAYLQSLGAE
ncbi:MAG: sugar phosphate isomerase/epimerase [Anaerolineaceae bacterium]|nr:MAG: sugar phosphate isomerase/epimerase [Anaerolineaceae bacterium]